jgi:septum formation protein
VFILASASPRRLQLLKQIGYVPDQVIPADIDETPEKKELADTYAARLAKSKSMVIAEQYPDAIILAADTVVACGRRILPKAEDEATARECLKLLSGQRHRVYTAIHVISPAKSMHRTLCTRLKFKRLEPQEIDFYISTNEWQGVAGGYAIQGYAERFIPWINGSHSAIVGLPLSETANLLQQTGLTSKYS